MNDEGNVIDDIILGLGDAVDSVFHWLPSTKQLRLMVGARRSAANGPPEAAGVCGMEFVISSPQSCLRNTDDTNV